MSLLDRIARWLGWPAASDEDGTTLDRRRYDRKWWRFDRRSVAPALLGSAVLGPHPALALTRPDEGVARTDPDAERGTRPSPLKGRRLYDATASAHWFGDWTADVVREVDLVMQDAAAQAAVPVLVAYNVPHRDFDAEGGGGAADATAYRDWIRDLARGIGEREAIVILEPDALALVSCLTHECRSERFSLLREAVAVLTSRTRARVYLDAGHALWVDAEEMAQRLHLAGVAAADGFALNVGATVSTERNLSYGEELSRRSNGEHFVIDTSRNGASDGDARFGRTGALPGLEPTLDPAHPRVDAFLWIEPDGRERRAARSA